MHNNRSLALIRGAALLAALAWSLSAAAQVGGLKATVVDRAGNRYEVDRLSYQGRNQLEYYTGGERRLVGLQEVDRLRLEGERAEEEQTIEVFLRTGRKETGRIVVGGSGSSPHDDAMVGGQLSNRLSGTTSLGPFTILLGEVREIILHYPEGSVPAAPAVLKATVVDLEGRRLEVANLRYRTTTRMDYSQGPKQRSVDLSKVERIEFADDPSAGGELRQGTFFLWSGKTVQGMVDASIVRLAGETDRMYWDRVNAAFTGNTAVGPFTIGLHRLKLIRFHKGEESASQRTPGAAPVDTAGRPQLPAVVPPADSAGAVQPNQ
jgi:hypothetical protein